MINHIIVIVGGDKMRKEDFLNEVEIFLLQMRVSPTCFGINALKNPSFIRDLRAGRECRESTQKKVIEFMKKYKSDNELL